MQSQHLKKNMILEKNISILFNNTLENFVYIVSFMYQIVYEPRQAKMCLRKFATG